MKKGEVWLVNLAGRGHEQSGARPAIILTGAVANTVVIVPCTSNIQALRFPYTLEIKPSKLNGLVTLSVALIFQLRAIDKARLLQRLGELDEKSLENLDNSIKSLLTHTS